MTGEHREKLYEHEWTGLRDKTCKRCKVTRRESLSTLCMVKMWDVLTASHELVVAMTPGGAPELKTLDAMLMTMWADYMMKRKKLEARITELESSQEVLH